MLMTISIQLWLTIYTKARDSIVRTKSRTSSLLTAQKTASQNTFQIILLRLMCRRRRNAFRVSFQDENSLRLEIFRRKKSSKFPQPIYNNDGLILPGDFTPGHAVTNMMLCVCFQLRRRTFQLSELIKRILWDISDAHYCFIHSSPMAIHPASSKRKTYVWKLPCLYDKQILLPSWGNNCCN